MESDSDVNSEGSDIEVENDDENDEFEYVEVERNADEWLDALFESDSEDEEFDGFQDKWVFENFTRRVPPRRKLIRGAVFEHPEDANAFHYFELLWTKDLWHKIVEETNRYAAQEREKNPPLPKSPKWVPVDFKW